MHVLHLYDGHEQVYEGKGSVPTVVWQFARETATRGHRVTVLERRWTGLKPTTTHRGVRFVRMNVPTGPDEPWTRIPYEQVETPSGLMRLVVDRTTFAAAALQKLRQLDPDVIHVHLPFSADVLALLVPGIQGRMVYTAHLGELRLDLLEGDAEGNVPRLLSIFSPDVFLAKRAAQTTVLNPSIREAFIDRGVPDQRLTVVPNGVDIERFGNVNQDVLARVQQAYNLDPDRPIILFVGTIMPRKGIKDLIDAVAAFDTTAQVVLAGELDLDAEYVRSVKTLIRENELTEDVRMPGFVPEEDLPGLYAIADVFALPSHEEGFGMTAVEALAAGTPVVGTSVGGLPEFVDSSVGTLVNTGDYESLARGIAEWLETPKEGVSERCRRRAENYSWSSIGEQVVELYAEVAQ